MEKVNSEKEKLELLEQKLYNINPSSAGSSIKVDSTALYLLELIEKYNTKKIAERIRKFIKENSKYGYPECLEIIEGVISKSNDYIRNMETNSNEIYDKYMKFIDQFNTYDMEYKINKDINLEIYQLGEKQRLINKNIEEANAKYESISKRIDKANYDLIGTISLFVGIIFAIYGGFQLTTSVFNYIGTTKFSYLVIALLVIGFVELSIISLLVHVIFKINNKSGKSIWIVDGVYFIIMIISIAICFYCIK